MTDRPKIDAAGIEEFRQRCRGNGIAADAVCDLAKQALDLQWVSVTERLPEHYEDVEGWFPAFDYPQWMTYYDSERRAWCSGAFIDMEEEPSHWRPKSTGPLPAPPTGGKL